jgi:hypothetical protein
VHPPEDAMSDSFKDREKGFENQFAHDLELQFRANARRNRLLGHWAAQLLGLTGDDEVRYALDVVKADFQEAGHEGVVRKLRTDLGDRADEETIRAKMAEFLDVAKGQLMSETR